MACTLSSSLYNPTATATFPTVFFSTSKYSFSPSIHLSRSFKLYPSNPIARLSPCHATTPGPPSPPRPDPEPQPPSSSSSSSVLIIGRQYEFRGLKLQSSKGHDGISFSATINRMQDTAQIFLAVLFWMSLFFWASAWDGRNGDKPSKGSRFRR